VRSSAGIRILIALGMFGAVYCAAPDIFVWRSRFLLAWDVASVFYLASLLSACVRADAAATRAFALRKPPRPGQSVLAIVTFAIVALASTASLFRQTSDLQSWAKTMHIALSFTAIATSWLIVHLSFALLYARSFFWAPDASDDPRHGHGLTFPGSEPLVLVDFVYFAMTIATCYATSDVAITRCNMRRLAMHHAIASFAFVTVLFGLTVNILAAMM
jgi:uncharacterized membrane protein